MKNTYIDQEVDKILHDSRFAPPLNKAMVCSWILANLKGMNLKIMHVGLESSLCEYFVLANAQNIIQAQSMADTIAQQMKRHQYIPSSREGSKEADWVLLDVGDVIIHIFLETARSIYDLDTLWKNSPQVPIPDSYYFQSQTTEAGPTTSEYF